MSYPNAVVPAVHPLDPGDDRSNPEGARDKMRILMRTIARRSRLIFCVVAMLTAIAWVLMINMTPRYTAAAQVLIGSPTAQVVDLKAVLAGLPGDADVIDSEMQVLQSSKIARQVIEKYDLANRAEFNPALRKPGLIATIYAAVASFVDGILPQRLQTVRSEATVPADRAAEDEPAEAQNGPTVGILNAFASNLSVSQKGHSRVIEVAFSSANPALAAQIANAMADTYINSQVTAKFDATAHAHKWLSDRVDELRQQVLTDDEGVEAYHRKLGLVQGQRGPLVAEEISALGEQIVAARADAAQAQARAQRVKSILPSLRGIEMLSDVQGMPVVQNLLKQENELLQQQSDLAVHFGERYPKLEATRAELYDIEGRIRAELARVVRDFEGDIAAANAREATLTARLSTLIAQQDTDRAGTIELQALQHDADADRALFDRVLARAKETSIESGLQEPDAEVISRADAPEKPSFPNPSLFLPVAFLASCIAAGLLVYALETLDSGFQSVEQLERTVGQPALGAVPQLLRGQARRNPGAYILANPISIFGESIRSLYTSLLLNGTNKPPKVVLVASALPGEGKSTIALCLARLMASCGKRVVIVDCDLRRPVLHKSFGVPQSPGLTECLLGEGELARMLKYDEHSPTCLLPAGSGGHTSPDLFASSTMHRLIETLSDRFDLVILDSAPVLAVSDTRHLCRLSDVTLFVVRWRETRQYAAVSALRHMLEAGGNPVGVVLSMVDLQQHARYSDSGSHYARLKAYLPE